MKKLIAILMICVMLCGCSKEEPKNTNTTTPAPTEETKPAADEPTSAPDSDPTPTMSLEELADAINEELDDSRLQVDIEKYDMLVSVIMLTLIDKNVAPIFKDIKGKIMVSKDGLSFEDLPDVFTETFLSYLEKEASEFTTYGAYIIGIDAGMITREKAPQK